MLGFHASGFFHVAKMFLQTFCSDITALTYVFIRQLSELNSEYCCQQVLGDGLLAQH